MCGIVGIHGHDEASTLAYLSLYALQHRGQESAGIVASQGGQLQRHGGMGQVADVFDQPSLTALGGRDAIGHVRYSTAGDSAALNLQPFAFRHHRGPIAIAHNGNIVNAGELRTELEREGSIFQTTSDTEVILHLAARSRQEDVVDALVEALRRTRGAFSLVMLVEGRLIAVRDPQGFRPLVLGRVDDGWVVASETCAFDLIGATYERDLERGELLVIDDDGVHPRRPLEPATPAGCFFEHVYFARPDSKHEGQSVQHVRKRLGARLFDEQPADVDLVAPVPDSGVAAALGYAQRAGIPFDMALVRNHYVGRTFIEPSQQIRNFGVRVKLNPVREALEGKRVALIDDSIVRGTTSRKIVQLCRDAGATEVHLRISCPPTIGPCHYGIDTPREEELIASRSDVEEIRRYVGADSLGYLSLDGMLDAAGVKRGEVCTACWTRELPVPLPAEDSQLALFRGETSAGRPTPESKGELA